MRMEVIVSRNMERVPSQSALRLIAYYELIERVFGDWARKLGLPIVLDFKADRQLLASGAGDAIPHLQHAMRIMDLEHNRQEKLGCSAGGILHAEQIKTFVECVERGLHGLPRLTIAG